MRELQLIGLQELVAAGLRDRLESGVGNATREAGGERKSEVRASLVRVRESSDLGRVEEEVHCNDVVSVALIDGYDVNISAKALLAGAAGVVTTSESPEKVLATVECAATGMAILPPDVAKTFAREHHSRTPPSGILTARQKRWLQCLGNGMNIEELATLCHYTPRHMRRLLTDLYSRIDARNLKHALTIAGYWGIATPSSIADRTHNGSYPTA